MRRKDREMSEEFGLDLIDRAEFGVLSITNPEGLPHTLPLSIARSDRQLFFHSATGGEKVGFFKDGKEVCVVFVSDVRVPDLYSNQELEQVLDEGKNLSMLGSKVFTTEFASAIVRGKIYRVMEDEAKITALRLISRRFVPDKMAYFEAAMDNALKITAIYRVEIETITAKRKKFDANREEMKFGRME